LPRHDQASLETPSETSTTSSTITFEHMGESFTIPIRYSALGADRIVPLVTELAEAMFATAICAERRRRGEKDGTGGGVTLSFEEREAARRYAVAQERVTFFLNLKS